MARNAPPGSEWEGWCFVSVCFLSSLYSRCSSWQAVRQRKTKTHRNKRFAVVTANWSRQSEHIDSDPAFLFQFCHTCFDVQLNTTDILQVLFLHSEWTGSDSVPWFATPEIRQVTSMLPDDLCVLRWCIFLCHSFSVWMVFFLHNTTLGQKNSAHLKKFRWKFGS